MNYFCPRFSRHAIDVVSRPLQRTSWSLGSKLIDNGDPAVCHILRVGFSSATDKTGWVQYTGDLQHKRDAASEMLVGHRGPPTIDLVWSVTESGGPNAIIDKDPPLVVVGIDVPVGSADQNVVEWVLFAIDVAAGKAVPKQRAGLMSGAFKRCKKDRQGSARPSGKSQHSSFIRRDIVMKGRRDDEIRRAAIILDVQ